MGLLHDRHIAKIEKQDDNSLYRAFRQLVDEEIKYEERLEIIRELKSYILIEIEIRNKKH